MNHLMTENEAAARKLITACLCKQLTVATAESCTGGMIGMTLTAVEGASAVYLGGVVSYANEVKEKLLGVSEKTLATVGAVSPETAEEMLKGVQKATDATLCVSVTGIAGPGGGTKDKPVGLVYIGVTDGRATKIEKVIFSGDRREVRLKTVGRALTMLLALAEAY